MIRRIPPAIPRAFRITFICAIAALVAGCNGNGASRPVSLSVWQGKMQSYVTDHANGDMNALRDVQVVPGHAGFRSFSTDRPEQSKDIAGVLVGVQPSSDRVWYVYLVGEVDREQMTSLRLAAVSEHDGQFTWRVGDDSAGGAAAYRAHRESVWRAQHAGQGEPPRQAYDFPAPDDQFAMQATGESITVLDSAASGAQWTLNLAAPQAVANAGKGG